MSSQDNKHGRVLNRNSDNKERLYELPSAVAREKAEAQYERHEKKKEADRKRGEGTWMLPGVSDRIDKDEQKVKKRKLKKQKAEKKKKKKEKKEKKAKKSKKKKKRKESSSSSSDSSSDSDSESEVEWREKSENKAQGKLQGAVGPKLEREDWMVDPLADLFGGKTRDQIREQKKKESGVEEEKPVIDQLGQHKNELNPFWKDGGSGMPEENPNKKKSKKIDSVSGDGGLSYWKKAYERCVVTAKEEGRSLDDVAADRYGSLKKLEKKVAEAEKISSKIDNSRHSRGWERDRVSNRGYDSQKYADRSRDRGHGGGYGGGGRFMKPGESTGLEQRKKIFMKPGEDREQEPQKKLAFMKPGEDSSYERGSSSSGWKKGGRDDSDNVPRWKKRGSSLQSQDDRDRSRDRSRERRRDRSKSREKHRSRSRDRRDRDRCGDRSRSRDRKRDRSRDRSDRRDRKPDGSDDSSQSRSQRKERTKQRSPSSSSASFSESESEEESSSEPSESESEPEPEPVKILTEDELNALGAKILRAEMMGNEEMAAKLKAEIEEARKAKESAPPAQTSRKPSSSRDKDNVVILTRTDREGNVRPLPESTHKQGSGSGRRKKEKVETHSKDGNRERYFADDDKLHLKDLVKQEKMNTAEDANRMFARLAGRSMEKTDDEYQLDDVMVNRANTKTSDANIAESNRSAAISEHKAMQRALEHCKFCFDHIPKHLIIAIGLKVILCLPTHKSMVPGHCLIVPMQHSISGTSVDDDVWAEIQVFRKGLTAMFREQGEDVVFMETSMRLKYLPHMCVEVIPMPSETGEMAPIYFKKAIQESDTEWAQNKKLIDLSKKNVRQSVPKGFPYFSVDFGLQGGFAHVIEDEEIFPIYFGREICGGMLDVELNLWRKPQKEDFERQRQKVLTFAEWWKPYDWTQKLKAEKDSDSD